MGKENEYKVKMKILANAESIIKASSRAKARKIALNSPIFPNVNELKIKEIKISKKRILEEE